MVVLSVCELIPESDSSLKMAKLDPRAIELGSDSALPLDTRKLGGDFEVERRVEVGELIRDDCG